MEAEKVQNTLSGGMGVGDGGGGGGLLPVIAFTGRLRPKEVPFQASGV